MTTPYPLPLDGIEALSRGEKAEALKLLRDQTGLGLKEAKDLIEWYSNRSGKS